MSIEILVALIVISLTYYCENRIGKSHKVSCLLGAILVVLLMGGNTNNADIQIYQRRYAEAQSLEYVFLNGQWANALFMYVCNVIGFDFQLFRICYYAVGMCFILATGKRYLGYSLELIILYMIFPMIIDATQMKNFMCMSIISYALPYLATGKFKDRIVYAVLCCLSAGFHIIAWAYLPLIIFCDTGLKKRYRAISVLPVIVFSLIFMNRNMSGVLSSALLNMLDENTLERTSRFLTSQVNNGYIVYVFETFLIILMLYLIRRESYRNQTEFSKDEVSFFDLIFMCAVYSIIFMPLYYYRQDFSRLLRNYAIMIHIALILFARIRKNGLTTNDGASPTKAGVLTFSSSCLLIYLLYAFYLIYTFYWDIMVYYDSVVLPFFNYNAYF